MLRSSAYRVPGQKSAHTSACKIKFKSFGKVTIEKKSTKRSAKYEDVNDKDEVEALFIEQEKEANDAIEKIKMLKYTQNRRKKIEIQKQVIGGGKKAV